MTRSYAKLLRSEERPRIQLLDGGEVSLGRLAEFRKTLRCDPAQGAAAFTLEDLRFSSVRSAYITRIEVEPLRAGAAPRDAEKTLTVSYLLREPVGNDFSMIALEASFESLRPGRDNHPLSRPIPVGVDDRLEFGLSHATTVHLYGFVTIGETGRKPIA